MGSIHFPRRLARAGLVAAVTAAIVGAGLLVLPATGRTEPAVHIGTINGQDATDGTVDAPLTGDTLTADGTARIEPGVLADAGASVARPVGSTLPVTGIASFGTAPYTFRWTHGGSTTRFAAPTSQTTTFDSTGLPGGPQTLTLTVTDALGDTDTDTVKVFLQAPATTTLLDVTDEIGPGVPEELGENVDGSNQEIPFVVPRSTEQLTVELSWDTPGSDLDLRLDDPSGAQDDNTTGATGANPERIVIDDPAAGDWAALLTAYLNPPETYHLTAVAEGFVPDPAPTLDAGGPYVFDRGDTQTLTATTTGGTAPVDVAWDLDGDNVFEASGATTTLDFGLGTHLVTVKAVDAAGYEKRETLGVRIVDGTLDNAPGIVVIAVADSGLNVYHQDFRAETYGDETIKALTNGFTRHPSEYLAGYPAT